MTLTFERYIHFLYSMKDIQIIVLSLLSNEIKVNSFNLLFIEKYFLYIIYIIIGKLYSVYLKLL